ncbi:MAG: MlaD family protein [Gemmatimonadetes bacterium]|nr:MlaD family protein [Gemmatimonadota bacterium]
MKRRDELLVGFTILLAMATVVGGALWLSEAHLGQGGEVYVARFRTVGGMGVGNPVVLRGVRVGRVEQIRLGDGDWVEAVLQIYPDVALTSTPAVIAASASLFGEWQASIVSFPSPNITDPNVRRDLELAAAVGDDVWPGSTLPDIGQLTAQAGRIASDIGAFSQRIETAFNDEAVVHLQSSIRDIGEIANQINEFAEQQTEIVGAVSSNVQVTSSVISETAIMLQRIIARVDSSTEEGALDSIVSSTVRVADDLQLAMSDFREFVGMVNANSASFERLISGADSVVTRLYEGDGTLARLVADSSLYVEANRAIIELRLLLAEIRENPRRFFKFTVF